MIKAVVITLFLLSAGFFMISSIELGDPEDVCEEGDLIQVQAGIWMCIDDNNFCLQGNNCTLANLYVQNVTINGSVFNVTVTNVYFNITHLQGEHWWNHTDTEQFNFTTTQTVTAGTSNTAVIGDALDGLNKYGGIFSGNSGSNVVFLGGDTYDISNSGGTYWLDNSGQIYLANLINTDGGISSTGSTNQFTSGSTYFYAASGSRAMEWGDGTRSCFSADGTYLMYCEDGLGAYWQMFDGTHYFYMTDGTGKSVEMFDGTYSLNVGGGNSYFNGEIRVISYGIFDSYVSIGTGSTPNYALDVSGDTYISGNVGIGTASSTQALLMRQPSDSNGWKLEGFDDKSGNVVEGYVDKFGQTFLISDSADSNAFFIADCDTGANAHNIFREAGVNRWLLGLEGSSNDFVIGPTTGTIKLRINPTGEVDINGTTQASNFTLRSGLPITGGNAGTDACVDANGMLCACGSCA